MMRSTHRLLARYLDAGTPTGLTGLLTHPSPRTTLLHLYQSTLNKLETVPESSLYRQSVEALTKHRMSVVKAAIPSGHAEWFRKASRSVGQGPHLVKVGAGVFNMAEPPVDVAGLPEEVQAVVEEVHAKGRRVEILLALKSSDDHWKVEKLTSEWNTKSLKNAALVAEYHPGLQAVDEGGDTKEAGAWKWRESVAIPSQQATRLQEGIASFDEHTVRPKEPPRVRLLLLTDSSPSENSTVSLESEPILTADQITELEAELGAGLIEEVIEAAEGELRLLAIMQNAKVWEALEEKPVEGQWKYFERSV